MLATLFALLSVLGLAEENTAIAWWLTLVAARIAAAITAVSAFVEWLRSRAGR